MIGFVFKYSLKKFNKLIPLLKFGLLMEFLTVTTIKGRHIMKELTSNYTEIFNKGIYSFIDDLVSDTKSAYEGILRIDISNKLNLKPNTVRSSLKVLNGLIDDALTVLSQLEVNWEIIDMMTEFNRLYQRLNCLFNVLKFIRLAGLSKLKIILCGTRKISARSDSYFKCILGHYRGKYRAVFKAFG
jgi:hypothetical protein